MTKLSLTEMHVSNTHTDALLSTWHYSYMYMYVYTSITTCNLVETLEDRSLASQLYLHVHVCGEEKLFPPPFQEGLLETLERPHNNQINSHYHKVP